MAETKIPKPSRLGDAPKPVESRSNLRTVIDGRRNAKDLNFKVAEDFHADFRAMSLARGLTMTAMLEEMADLYRRHHDLDEEIAVLTNTIGKKT